MAALPAPSLCLDELENGADANGRAEVVCICGCERVFSPRRRTRRFFEDACKMRAYRRRQVVREADERGLTLDEVEHERKLRRRGGLDAKYAAKTRWQAHRDLARSDLLSDDASLDSEEEGGVGHLWSPADSFDQHEVYLFHARRPIPARVWNRLYRRVELPSEELEPRRLEEVVLFWGDLETRARETGVSLVVEEGNVHASVALSGTYERIALGGVSRGVNGDPRFSIRPSKGMRKLAELAQTDVAPARLDRGRDLAELRRPRGSVPASFPCPCCGAEIVVRDHKVDGKFRRENLLAHKCRVTVTEDRYMGRENSARLTVTDDRKLHVLPSPTSKGGTPMTATQQQDILRLEARFAEILERLDAAVAKLAEQHADDPRVREAARAWYERDDLPLAA